MTSKNSASEGGAGGGIGTRILFSGFLPKSSKSIPYCGLSLKVSVDDSTLTMKSFTFQESVYFMFLAATDKELKIFKISDSERIILKITQFLML